MGGLTVPLTQRALPAPGSLPVVSFKHVDAGVRVNAGVPSVQAAHYGYNSEEDWSMPDSYIRWLRAPIAR